MLYTEREALGKTFLSMTTLRRYLRIWEEFYCPLPTDVANRKLVGATLLRLLQEAEDTRCKKGGTMTERLEDYLSFHRLVDIAEDYANSGVRLHGSVEFLFNVLRLSARRAHREAFERHLESTMKVMDLQTKMRRQEKALEDLRQRVM